MPDLATRLDQLRTQIDMLGDSASASQVSELEAEARALMAQAKNTEYEPEARELFTLLAKRSAPSAARSESPSEVRGLLRRARIRLDVANDDSDIDEAIDILAEALALDPNNAETLQLLGKAAQASAQHAAKVDGLVQRYGLTLDAPPPTPASPPPPVAPAAEPSLPAFTPPPAAHAIAPMPSEGDPLAEVSKAYYAGDYQKAVEAADRVLAKDSHNAQALDYRQKAADNLMRGIVPDHRIPFDARVAYNRANSLVRAGNYDEAQQLYKEARDLASRAGIPQWKDVEQALLDIQDLALARELLNEGDRLLAADDWEGALRKYDGALRVVPNDPLAEERIELVKRVKTQYDQASVQLNMMTGSLLERAETLTRLLGTIGTIRQVLPSSERLQLLVVETNSRMGSIKTQLLSQAGGLMTRADGASSLEEKSKFSQEALGLLNVAVSLDATDPTATGTLQRAEQLYGKAEEARQIIEKAAGLIAQNSEGELSQARSLLANLRDAATDNMYRATVADLFASHLGHVDEALDRGDAVTAERWLRLTKEEPFRILGRRTEVLQREDEIRKIRRGVLFQRLAIGLGIIAVLILVVFLSRSTWEAALFPTATPTSTASTTPTASFTPSNTPTETPTFTPTFTPSLTVTASPTVTASLTPTHTFTPSITPTFTESPTITPTPLFLCEVRIGANAVRVRTSPSANADSTAVLQPDQSMVVLEQRISPDNQLWYRIQATVGDSIVTGWIRADLVEEVTDCPNF